MANCQCRACGTCSGCSGCCPCGGCARATGGCTGAAGGSTRATAGCTCAAGGCARATGGCACATNGCTCATGNPVEPVVYESTAEWPDLSDLCPNTEAACLLREYLASETGKLTKANEYLYQSGALSKANAEIAAHMRAIQAVETMHTDRLARVIAALGADPVFMSAEESDCAYWTAEYMSTARGLRTLLTRNIAAEEALISENRRLSEQIPILSVRAFLSRLAEDDTIHVALNRRLLNELND